MFIVLPGLLPRRLRLVCDVSFSEGIKTDDVGCRLDHGSRLPAICRSDKRPRSDLVSNPIGFSLGFFLCFEMPVQFDVETELIGRRASRLEIEIPRMRTLRPVTSRTITQLSNPLILVSKSSDL